MPLNSKDIQTYLIMKKFLLLAALIVALFIAQMLYLSSYSYFTLLMVWTNGMVWSKAIIQSIKLDIALNSGFVIGAFLIGVMIPKTLLFRKTPIRYGLLIVSVSFILSNVFMLVAVVTASRLTSSHLITPFQFLKSSIYMGPQLFIFVFSIIWVIIGIGMSPCVYNNSLITFPNTMFVNYVKSKINRLMNLLEEFTENKKNGSWNVLFFLTAVVMGISETSFTLLPWGAILGFIGYRLPWLWGIGLSIPFFVWFPLNYYSILDKNVNVLSLSAVSVNSNIIRFLLFKLVFDMGCIYLGVYLRKKSKSRFYPINAYSGTKESPP